MFARNRNTSDRTPNVVPIAATLRRGAVSYVLVALLVLLAFDDAAHAADRPGASNGSMAPYSVTPAPTWLTSRSIPEPPASGEEYPAVLLLHDRQTRLGTVRIDHFRFAMRAMNSEGVGQVAQLRIGLNPAFQKLAIHHIRVIRDGVTRNATSGTHFRLLQREERLHEGIQDGYVTAVAVLDDVRTGDIVDYAYSLTGSNPIFGRRAFGASVINGPWPVGEFNFRIDSPVINAAPRILLRNASAEVRESRQGQWRSQTVTLTRLPALAAEEQTPAWRDPYSWVEFSEYDSWPAVAGWASELYKMPDDHGREFTALHARLHSESTGKADFITRALRFVQQEIRYEGLEFGENAHRPRAASETLSRRLGDCKDKSQLLVALLRREGISAWPALVATQARRSIADGLSSPGAFDHVIVAVELDGTRYFLDGTRTHDGGDLSHVSRSDFDLALLVDHDTRDLLPMYRTRSVPVVLEQSEDYYADDFSSPVRYEVRTVYRDFYANYQRYRFSSRPASEIQKRYREVYASSFPDIESAGNLVIVDDRLKNEFTVTESWLIPNFWRRGEELMSAPIRLLAFSDLVYEPRQRTRQTPFSPGIPSRGLSETRIHYPLNPGLQFSLKPSVLENAFFRYRYTDYAQGAVYSHVAELELFTDEIPASETPAFARDFRTLQKQWEFSINTELPEHVGFDSIRALRQHIRKANHP